MSRTLVERPYPIFDREIPFSLWVSSHIAAHTRDNRERLTDLQHAACQIVPQGINLALSIRELIRQGYLFAALVLIRPLIERAAIISYIHDHPEAIEVWKGGWPAVNVHRSARCWIRWLGVARVLRRPETFASTTVTSFTGILFPPIGTEYR